MRTLLCLLVALCYQVSVAQWVTRAAMPEARSSGAGALVGNSFFCFGGATVGDFNNLTAWRYDIPSNTWTAIAPMPTTGVGNGGANSIDAAAIGTDIYCVGGYTGSSGLTRLLRYNTLTNQWSTVTTDPLSVNIFANATVALGGKLYALGGNQGAGAVSRNAFVYDPALSAGNRWSAIPQLNIGRRYAAAMTDGIKIYVLGGVSGAGVELSSGESWQPGDAAWTNLPAMSRGRGGAGGFGVFGRPYVVGGGYNSPIATGEAFDSVSWLTGLSLNGVSRTFGSDYSARFLIKAGGWTGAYSNVTELLDIATHPTTMTLPKGAFAAGNTVSNLIYSDDLKVEVRPGAVLTASERPIQVVIEGTTDPATPLSVSVGLESSASVAGINQWVEAYNWVNGSWVQADQRAITIADSSGLIALPSPLGRFISGSGTLRLRISAKAAGGTLIFPWRLRLDEVTWRIDRGP